ncbi:hypothetical protein FHP05_07030 [Cerasibacillus terrae]|uniref:Uncharacterized protein n=1 Tax=Cerasibacillus terrae TaxID=2498845 RepID=A0A5C8NY11_9BACI|nr:hypothetical protein [Cerasibacillus terrae]TXL65863.1 hypothetical protein FHP05_07030 [Cerasibacillus terrae]
MGIEILVTRRAAVCPERMGIENLGTRRTPACPKRMENEKMVTRRAPACMESRRIEIHGWQAFYLSINMA